MLQTNKIEIMNGYLLRQDCKFLHTRRIEDTAVQTWQSERAG